MLIYSFSIKNVKIVTIGKTMKGMNFIMTTKKIIIIGAAGRDFHNFNVFYRDDPAYEVVAFTAAQIPDIAGRKYPGFKHLIQ